MLDALSVELHELLAARPQTEAQLLESLADVIQSAADSSAAAEDLRHHLIYLQGIGLLREQRA